MNAQTESQNSNAENFFSGKGVEYALIAASICFVTAALGVATSVQLVVVFLGCLSLLLGVAGWTSWMLARTAGAEGNGFEAAGQGSAASGATSYNAAK